MSGVKSHYSCAELAALRLPGYPASERRCRDLVEREGWAFREVKSPGKNGTRREYVPPKGVVKLIQQRALAVDDAAPALAAGATAPAHAVQYAVAAPVDAASLSDVQRERDRCRAMILRFVDDYAGSVEEAVAYLNQAYAEGKLSAGMKHAIERSNDKLRPGRLGRLSKDTVKKWKGLQKKRGSLAPIHPQKDLSVKCWHKLAVALKQRPQGSLLTWIEEQIAAQWDALPHAEGDAPPSYDTLRRFFGEKFSAGDQLKGRWSGQQLRAKQFYVERTTDGMLPWDEVHADGWTTHFTAPHPVTGEYVTYEIWDFHDVATGYVTPFGIGLRENFEVILKGLENCVREGGVMAHLMTDSTKIVKNSARFKGDFVAALEHRIGLTIVHPQTVGSAQTNGISEGFHSWLDKRSKEIATYHGKAMDSLTHRRVKKLTEKAVKAKDAGDLLAYEKLLKEAGHAGKGLVFKSREEACAWLEKQRRIWNTMPCRNFPKIRDPQSGKLRHMSRLEKLEEFKAKGWRPVWLGQEADHEAHLIDLFRPHVQAKVSRGAVKPYGGMRFRHADLDHWEGKTVVVAYDQWDWRQVWVKDLKGEAICMAAFAEATGYRAQTAQEAAEEKRAAAQKRLLHRKAVQIDARTPGLALDGTLTPTLSHGEREFGSVIELKRVDAPVIEEAEVIPLKRVEVEDEAPREPMKGYLDMAMFLYGDEEDSEEALEAVAVE